jgi:hypothetical protein
MNKVSRGSCLSCPGSDDILALDTVLYQGFGGYHVEKDGEVYYWPDSNLEWDAFKTLADIEKAAKRHPKSIWHVVLNNPLRGAIWERRRGSWHLIETNCGFA